MRALFVAGTGTDLGKTHVACALLRAARARGLGVDAFKPVVSGFDSDAPQTSDPARLVAALGRPDAWAEVSPRRYRAPLAPHLAARLEGDALASYFETLRQRIEALRVRVPGGALRMTVSIGVRTATPGDDLHRLLGDADRRLYLAKAGGRNRVVMAG